MTREEPVDVLAAFSERCEFDGLGTEVAVGCSGGPDSVALLASAAAAGLAPTALHVDHGLREGSDREVALVARVAERVGVPWRGLSVDVVPGANLEARARDARYRALHEARREMGTEWLLVGHTADDQAETVLLNVLRGAATTGIAGMAPRRDHVARPLLGVRRAETRELCRALGLDVLDDPMNDDERFSRVKVRRRVLPLLQDVAGRDLVPVLARQAAVLGEESAFLDELARAAWPGTTASARDLAALHPVLARRAVRLWLGPPPPSRDEVSRVLDVARGDHRATQLEGGCTVRRSAGVLLLERV